MRKYKRQLGSRPYRDYTTETLNNAVQMIISKKTSIRGAAVRLVYTSCLLFLITIIIIIPPTVKNWYLCISGSTFIGIPYG